ncbi:multicopper oxidase [Corynebacterium diphtheriae]|nr:multicopper oxidase [Corynebacterium diphtheriae]CAB0705532.1 multicopper oxidase [Corynebacterium diphtheriae]CAB0705811.1 multicopper oxidase [Corynebacterium diphtheriae]CAB0776254.1 multicopper oxidase [Corynebacterium diphtheriae]CAB0825482.1 multicopper oxidase [Corynebacterium diphtheriae]
METKESTWSAIWAVGGVAAIMLAILAGLGYDTVRTALMTRQEATVAAPVKPTGETTEVTVVATENMSYEPSVVEVPVGNELIINLVNNDPHNGHDLVVGDKKTDRVAPGKSTTLDVGLITESMTGFCSVAGHRQMGMTLRINAGSHAHHQHGSLSEHFHQSTRISAPISPVLSPLEQRTTSVTHEATFTVSEVPLEVAPGVWQTRWTFNGSGVGPTLHGKVGDKFRITLVNNGTIGHSIDFHAGELAPDEKMRTIGPGESLIYEFTAGRAGIWMYHCSTMPMAAHIAAGMHGAVVIEPVDLAPVDKQFVLVQSEVYVDSPASSPQEATELRSEAIGSEPPNHTVFNGIAFQYDQEKLDVKVGERVRFWVLDAGPNVPLSFHIVGGQFDTTWTEGAYTLYRGSGGIAGTHGVGHDGGAQVLPLLPAQGGFVELTFDEPGNYAVVNHLMSEAERGARGTVRVTK